jgi:hypothetical protein
MVAATAAQYNQANTTKAKSSAATIAALSQLWQFYSRPELLEEGCRQNQIIALMVLLGLGAAARLLVYFLVKIKVMRKASE